MKRKKERDGYKERLSDPGDNSELIVVIKTKLDDFGILERDAPACASVGDVYQRAYLKIQ